MTIDEKIKALIIANSEPKPATKPRIDISEVLKNVVLETLEKHDFHPDKNAKKSLDSFIDSWVIYKLYGPPY